MFTWLPPGALTAVYSCLLPTLNMPGLRNKHRPAQAGTGFSLTGLVRNITNLKSTEFEEISPLWKTLPHTHSDYLIKKQPQNYSLSGAQLRGESITTAKEV